MKDRENELFQATKSSQGPHAANRRIQLQGRHGLSWTFRHSPCHPGLISILKIKMLTLSLWHHTEATPKLSVWQKATFKFQREVKYWQGSDSIWFQTSCTFTFKQTISETANTQKVQCEKIVREDKGTEKAWLRCEDSARGHRIKGRVNTIKITPRWWGHVTACLINLLLIQDNCTKTLPKI